MGEVVCGEDVCRDYLRNVCSRGSKCRFKHPPQVLDNFSLTFSFNSQEERSKFSRSMCHDFQNTMCVREGCKYIHCSKDDEENFMECGSLPTYVLEDAVMKSMIPSLPGEAPVCRDYLNGECRRGKTCKFRHLSHCKYKKELDVLFGVEAEPEPEEPPSSKRIKPNQLPCAPFSQAHYPQEKCKLYCYTADRCSMLYAPCHGELTQQQENVMLKKQILDLKKQVSDLTAANEYLLDQNATLRLTRKNGGVVTPATLVTTPVSVQPATGQLVAVSGQNAIAAGVPVSIASGPGAGQMTLSTVGSTQQLVPVSCTASGQQIVAAVSSVGQTQQQLVSNTGNLVSVSAVPVSLATVSVAHVPIVTAASEPPHSIAMSVSPGTPLMSYPIMTQHLLPTR